MSQTLPTGRFITSSLLNTNEIKDLGESETAV
jgi:hypothetical protein